VSSFVPNLAYFSHEDLHDDFYNLLVTVVMLTLIFQLATALLPWILRSHKFGFGSETVTDNWFSDVIVTASPVGLICETINISRPDRNPAMQGLKHSLFFTDPDFPSVLATWISKH